MDKKMDIPLPETNDGLCIVENKTEYSSIQIQTIMRQTEYTETQAIEKLNAHNNDTIQVIKEYMGIQAKPVQGIKSVNQEIYKQIRGKLDGVMREYNQRTDK